MSQDGRGANPSADSVSSSAPICRRAVCFGRADLLPPSRDLGIIIDDRHTNAKPAKKSGAKDLRRKWESGSRSLTL